MLNFIRRNRSESVLKARIAELEARLEDESRMHRKVCQHNATLNERNERQLKVIEELSGTIQTKALTRLKFSCIMPTGTLRESEFTLGLGRCGKTVEALELKRTDAQFIITQWHTDGSKKVFTYRDGDIVGRVQECYEVVEVKPNTHYIERLRQALAFERRARMLGRK